MYVKINLCENILKFLLVCQETPPTRNGTSHAPASLSVFSFGTKFKLNKISDNADQNSFKPGGSAGVGVI